MWTDTHPHRRYDPQSARRYEHVLKRRRSRKWKLGCLLLQLAALGVILLVLAYFLFPLRTTILVLGSDARPGEGDLGRTDTIILATIHPLRPYVGALSIPRDLWVEVPGQGPNRINTAHFFAEAEEAGTGPAAAIEAVRLNFGVQAGYYLRLRFEDFTSVVDALGGIDVTLPEAMSGYPAGRHHLDGEQALALVRDRAGSDDFFRMGRGQVFLKAVVETALQPGNWPRLPAAMLAALQAIETDVPAWMWPRLGVALLRAGPNGIDSRSISREMVTPFTTSGGAAVLEPNWDVIDPVLAEMFDSPPPAR